MVCRSIAWLMSGWNQIFNAACCIVQIVLVNTLYLNTSDSVDREQALKLWYSAEILQVLAAVLGRASLAVLILRIFGFKPPYRFLIIFSLVSTVGTGILFVSTTLAQCDVTNYTSSCISVRAWGILGIVTFGLSMSSIAPPLLAYF